MSIAFGYSLVLGTNGLEDAVMSIGDTIHNAMSDDELASKDMAYYYFVDNTFVGSYEEEQWHSVSDEDFSEGYSSFYLKNILKVPEYHLYSLTEKIDVATRIHLNISGGIMGFSDADIQAMSKYGYDSNATSDNSSRWFDLPMILKGKSKEVPIPNYNFGGSFYEMDLEKTRSEWKILEPKLATNATYSLLPSPIMMNENAEKAHLKILKDIFQKHNMKDAVPNIDSICRGDFDQNGELETLFVANNLRGDMGWRYIGKEEVGGKSGAYALAILLQDDGSYDILHQQLSPYDFQLKKAEELVDIDYAFQLDFAGAYDLNNDGKFEFCFVDYQWEGGNTFVLSQDKHNQWQKVLWANWGM